MVQEKDAVKNRMQSVRELEKKCVQELEQNTIKFSWHVGEHTPGYNTGGYYDTDISEKNVKVSPVFDTEEEARDWMNAHEPDEGKTLYIKRMRLVRRTHLDWVNY